MKNQTRYKCDGIYVCYRQVFFEKLAGIQQQLLDSYHRYIPHIYIEIRQ